MKPLSNPREAIKKNDGLYAYYFSAQLANLLARFGSKFKWITPNLYTSISFILSLAACPFFILLYKSYWYLIIAVILINISFIFDCADGQLSRITGRGSQFGKFYDYFSDRIKDGALVICIALGSYFETGILALIIIAAIAIFIQYLRYIARLYLQSFELEYSLSKPQATQKKHNNQFINCLKHTLVFKDATRIALFTIFGIFNIIPWILPIYLVLEIINTAVFTRKTFKKIKRFDKNG